jgi:maltose alpha-D-glucosyltransferase / alpha-amylase
MAKISIIVDTVFSGHIGKGRHMTEVRAPGDKSGSFWYKDAVFYEVHVRAFADSNGDGIGDFEGLIGKLDYLRDLGVTAIWLLPFFPSPLKDDGYDISDYTAVHPAYGTLDDFRTFLDEAHTRDLKVIIELVLNHTSDQHPWFQRARRAPAGSPERDFYVWSDTPEKYPRARVIFQDYEQSNWTWDPVADAYFWHRFYAHQPDLNFDHQPVRKAIFEAVDFWLEMGVDGLRLDAVPYLVEREGTSAENLPETHGMLKELRQHVDARFPGRMLLAEANQWPEDAAAYFGDGDECHMAFHFPLMPRLFMAVRTEDRLPVMDIMAQTPEIPDSCQWALFLRNHDELTLEMVTEEERLYMYRAFAPAEESRINLGIRHRLAPLLENSRRRIELLNALMCSLPGTPVIYYGDEIGMGDNIYLGDRGGVRTPMQWSADRNAGFSTAHPQRLYLPLIVDYEYHHDSVHVEAQEQNSHSLLAYMKRLLTLRKRIRAFGRGNLEFLEPSNHRVLAFIRAYEDERILVVANLSRFGQAVELDLHAYAGMTPVELIGRTPFWEIDDSPYKLTLGPHSFYWFALTPSPVPVTQRTGTGRSEAGEQALPVLTTDNTWAEIVAGRDRDQLEQVLPDFLGNQPWFRGLPGSILSVSIFDAVPLGDDGMAIFLAPTIVTYSDRDAETYLLALHVIPVEDNGKPSLPVKKPFAHIRSGADGDAVLADAIEEGTINEALLWLTWERTDVRKGTRGTLMMRRTIGHDTVGTAMSGTVATSHVSNGKHAAGDGDERLLVKFLRRINEGINPEWEIGATLTNEGFPRSPTVLGALEYRREHHPPTTLAVVQSFVPNEGNAWEFTLDELHQYVANALHQGLVVPKESVPCATDLLDDAERIPPQPVGELLRPDLSFARLLGQRTAELHTALASIEGQPAFAPEPYTTFSQRSLYQSMRGLTARVVRSLRQALPHMTEQEQKLADTIVDSEFRIYDRFKVLLAQPVTGSKIRAHGDFHLGQVLRTGDDVVIVDFEGEPDRYFEERRMKVSPLRDVAGMLQSFRNAATAVGDRHAEKSGASAEERGTINALLLAWYRWAGAAFLESYRQTVGNASFLPDTREEWATMIDALLLEKAVYEVGYSLNHTPDTVGLALRSVHELIGDPEDDQSRTPSTNGVQ